MADHFWGRIDVGGTLRRRDLPRFCAAIGLKEPEQIDGRWDYRFVHEDDEAMGGQFEELENLCRELGLPYIRQSDGKYEFSPEIVFWLPGMEGPLGTLTDHGGHMQVSMDVVRQIRDALRVGQVTEATSLAEEAVVDLPVLPVFSICADTD